MLTYINNRLNEWALWKKGARRVVGGISPFPAYNLSGSGGLGGGSAPPALSYVPVNELECAEVDRCVCALDPLLKQCIDEFYLRIGGVREAVVRCDCSEKTLYRRLDDAHNKLLGYLNDLAAGVTVTPWSAREIELNIVTMPIKTKRLTRVTGKL